MNSKKFANSQETCTKSISRTNPHNILSHFPIKVGKVHRQVTNSGATKNDITTKLKRKTRCWLYFSHLTCTIPELTSFCILFITRGFFMWSWAAFGFSCKSTSTCICFKQLSSQSNHNHISKPHIPKRCNVYLPVSSPDLSGCFESQDPALLLPTQQIFK